MNTPGIDLEQGFSRRRRSSVIDSFHQLLSHRRGSVVGHFFERFRETQSIEAEWTTMQHQVMTVKRKLHQRSMRDCRARVRCVAEYADDDVPYELMGQVTVISLISLFILFGWLASMELSAA